MTFESAMHLLTFAYMAPLLVLIAVSVIGWALIETVEYMQNTDHC